MGAALLNKLVLDTNIGSSLPERVDWLHQQLTILRQKLEVLVSSSLPMLLNPMA